MHSHKPKSTGGPSSGRCGVTASGGGAALAAGGEKPDRSLFEPNLLDEALGILAPDERFDIVPKDWWRLERVSRMA